jgi:hypothetical protein
LWWFKGKILAENGGLDVLLEPDGVLGNVGPLKLKNEDDAVPLWFVTFEGKL